MASPTQVLSMAPIIFPWDRYCLHSKEPRLGVQSGDNATIILGEDSAATRFVLADQAGIRGSIIDHHQEFRGGTAGVGRENCLQQPFA